MAANSKGNTIRLALSILLTELYLGVRFLRFLNLFSCMLHLGELKFRKACVILPDKLLIDNCRDLFEDSLLGFSLMLSL